MNLETEYPRTLDLGDGISIPETYIFELSPMHCPIKINRIDHKLFKRKKIIEGLYEKGKAIVQIPKRDSPQGSYHGIPKDLHLLRDGVAISAEKVLGEMHNISPDNAYVKEDLRKLDEPVKLISDKALDHPTSAPKRRKEVTNSSKKHQKSENHSKISFHGLVSLPAMLDLIETYSVNHLRTLSLVASKTKYGTLKDVEIPRSEFVAAKVTPREIKACLDSLSEQGYISFYQTKKKPTDSFKIKLFCYHPQKLQ